MSKLRLGVMGGTFDPIHNGHLFAANEVANIFKLDQVIFVPAAEPWQKSSFSSAAHRLKMTVLATKSNKKFKVSRVDLDRSGPTYTVDTLRDLRKAHPDAELFFILGSDALSNIETWKGVDELWSLAHFVAVSRPGHPFKLPKSPIDAISVLEMPSLAISATNIRERVNQARPIDYLLPSRVVKYISRHGLYQGSK